MTPDQTNNRFDLELRRLEKRLEELVVVCRQLQEENKSLQAAARFADVGARQLAAEKRASTRARRSHGRPAQRNGAGFVSGAGTFAHVTIRILEKEYNVACPLEEKASLLASAEFLNGKMKEIRDSGKVVGLDRVAVMAALNIANELLQGTGPGRRAEEHRRPQDSRHARASRFCTRPGEAAQPIIVLGAPCGVRRGRKSLGP